ncbi:hypothetical protein OW763_13435 [Clostridium aestuarii]|uniref:Uncharacterized protein n=1 Tax=Clostridium aestuarii TaxID=338193 RepID=A0ABT4D557_9CLOT|nr:hypothetical protein [Clostridium aestuarii]MCY6485335.1 hypothetical protein [Clostridium aestuarii]
MCHTTYKNTPITTVKLGITTQIGGDETRDKQTTVIVPAIAIEFKYVQYIPKW